VEKRHLAALPACLQIRMSAQRAHGSALNGEEFGEKLKTFRARSFSAAHRKKTFRQAFPQPLAPMRPLLLVNSIDIECNMHTSVGQTAKTGPNLRFLNTFLLNPAFWMKKVFKPLALRKSYTTGDDIQMGHNITIEKTSNSKGVTFQ
jgi:hypothetical protein